MPDRLCFLENCKEKTKNLNRKKIQNFPLISSNWSVHPKVFETSYIRKEYLEQELRKLLLGMSDLEYKDLNDYDKGGYDGFNQAITLVLKKLQN
ncbi:hypothetical protein LEP1GSC202_3065 [Leptospira yanagawae serovar Saopaulo str. Sao Paulo = ATCC 700523]|uniref:Uncharacterized protein n=1 Tax=Leptospira yanagawae serovar Saopaulo str. Sao Paulo = ATCC 700523 TaxID=1249483 RepID=A0A5E8HAV3_9LEPT|nr:hypothetical protein LEP1GSC202_3065 [Leptospira yanagawae serovar Saopaulo str. Sao Paulo = ATCC 700523]